MLDVILPNFDVNDVEAKITDIFVEEGQFIIEGSLLLKVENTKAIHEIHSKGEGYIKLLFKKYDTVKKGEKIAVIFKDKKSYDEFIKEKQDLLSKNNEFETQNKIKPYNKTQERDPLDLQSLGQNIIVTDKALSLAQHLNINMELVKKIKKTGLIKAKDVQDFYDNQKSSSFNLIKPFNKFDRERVMLIGAGKGAEIVIDILLDDYDKHIVGLIDTYAESFEIYPYPLIRCNVENFPQEIDANSYDSVIITFGSSLNTFQYRKKIFKLYEEHEILFSNAVEKNCNFRRNVGIGKGNIICGNSYFGTGTVIGDNNFISYGANIGHHNSMGSHNLIAPGFATAGFVNIGDGCIITTGVITRSKLSIGNNVVLPLGYTVLGDIEDNAIIQQISN